MKISICIPVFNSENTIENLINKISNELQDYQLEFVLVNDYSIDNSDSICNKILTMREDVVYLSLRKNFGEHNAVMCCLNHISGDCAVIIDDDFQNPPSEIIKLVSELYKGYDVVYSKYLKKNHNIFRNLGSSFNNLIATWLLDKPINLYLSSFKVIKKDLVQEIIKYKGPFPYIDGLILSNTRNITSVIVHHGKRENGKSNYTFKKLVTLWLNMFLNFSIKPIRLFTLFGFIISLFSFCLIIYIFINKIIYPSIQPGWSSLMAAMSFFAGLQILFFGLIAEYIGKNYLTNNNTPQWTINKKN